MRTERPAGQRRTLQGFTLLEVLVVIAIIGILAGALVALSARNYRKSQLRDGAVQLMTDLNRARSLAQRSSFDSTVQIMGQLGAPSSTYTTLWGGGATPVTRSLPTSVQVAPLSSAASARTLTYSAPYAETDSIGTLWEVSSSGSSDRLYLKAVGVTGKVILSASN
ncbi:type II secretion system GspH family protein [Deinococcus sp. KNUC1210]|uniref:pilus assembly FimT family protein n=1 Tax=Deinococcus sp. KNUC1210 TaxID=2917691 RepID=UPI001EF05E20|nr:type II secretion system protein [Deinococcus sp. KNUC1210]ULH16793.1 type II secretion system GspH family protein [Deinococcus sp. KNUC1210]